MEDLTRLRSRYFPVRARGGFVIRPADREEVLSVVKKFFPRVFAPRDRGLFFQPRGRRRLEILEAQRRYAVIHHEWFLFCDRRGRPVGWSYGEAEDAVTFYMRNTGILPAHQNRGLYAAFLKAFSDYIGAAGYERITSQHQATNRRILILKLRHGFDVAGLELTENWGPLVKLVKILREDRRRVFYRQFGAESHQRRLRFPRR